MKTHKKLKTKYTNEPIGEIQIVDDFLPKPKDIVLKKQTEKVTISSYAST